MHRLIAACLGLCVALRATAAEAPPTLEEQIHQPGPLPDRITLTWRGDPARSMAVTWRTDTSVRKALAQFAPAEAGPQFESKAQDVPAVTTLLDVNPGKALYHSAHFENLNPRTKYVYRVGDGNNWSEWSHFQTASERPEPFSFLYFGDAQYDIRSHWSRLVREAYATAPRARFSVHAGDLINVAGKDAEWGEWSQAAGWINLSVPVVPTPGNHEYGAGTATSDLTRHWRAQFALPEHGPAGLEETVYYLDYQGVRVISLNSNEKLAEQVPWLERVLANNPNRWTVVTFHHPVLASAIGRDNVEVRRRWQPLFDKYRVDLVLQGHDHSYGRSGLQGFPGTRGGGTVYVVSVSGPRFYHAERMGWMRRRGEGIQLFQVISVDGDRLRYEARTATGQLHDSFELHKQPGRPNLLVEGPPEQFAPLLPALPQVEPVSRRTLLVLLLIVLVVVLLALRASRRAARRAPARLD